jgi:archaellum component FlaG (FlaF/FlaG flagellin family)
MRTSRIVTFAAVIAIAASVVGTTVFFTTNWNDTAQSSDTAAPATDTLEPIVVVAVR